MASWIHFPTQPQMNENIQEATGFYTNFKHFNAVGKMKDYE